ncbi:MAG TPA: hypothetical protein PKL24_03295 [Polyangiaceae bacterium]|jgi:hypothetical protein|nr:MAG: hypothetical protein BWY17_02370 [Deltaproteobacteria bacterium ADurb.Bin207]HNZ21141.1 hypothetical protein [Polyangiaceae bacterium]HOD24550.1 hypothetical protein [Polyangiaceae bacterium]HOE47911.1 hypothetical protein [Polyangiaceae bacterium]HOG99011.1 hypothetical protein [Polyangiaceae bacterium]
MNSFRTILVVAALTAIAAPICLGCEENSSKPSPSSKPKPDDETVAVDPAIGKVLAASSASPDTAPSPTQDDGPPATGVFSPDRANATHAVNAPIHIEVGTLGSEPRIRLLPTSMDVPKSLSVTIATQLGARTSLPTVDIVLGLTAPKPKSQGDEAPDLALPVSAKISKISLSAQQPGQIPKEIADEVAKMKDSKASWSFEPNGGIRIGSIERSPKARPELEHNLVVLMETLAAASIAAPKEPVGVGATWIARSRDVYGGLDLVSYRMFKVAKIDGENVSLVVETRQYAASDDLQKPGLPEGAKLVQFESLGAGEFIVTAGHRFAESGSYSHGMKFGLRPPNAADNQLMPLILQSTVAFPIAR